MFGKLMKAEWRSSRRVIGALCAIVLISGVLLGLMGHIMLRAAQGDWNVPDFFAVVFVLVVMLAILAVAASLGASLFYALWRYYKSRFTEEGYLTYTLPVNNHQLMLSSILASILEILLVALATLVAVAAAFGIFSIGLPWNEVDGAYWLGEIMDSFRPFTGDMARMGITAVLMGLSMLLTLMLSVTIGAMAAKKHPILLAIVVYYGISFLRDMVSLSAAMASETLISRSTLGTLNIVNVLTILAAYFLMDYLTRKKLNLN